MKFLLCDHDGCNRKYKTEVKWLRHVQTAHGDKCGVDFTLPEWIEVDNKNNRNNSSASLVYDHNKSLEEARVRRAAQGAKERLAEELGNKCYEDNALVREAQKIVVEKVAECVICFDGAQNALCFPCMHAVFCLPCITSVFNRSKICPICRADISWAREIFQ